jgi:hypothetical protein
VPVTGAGAAPDPRGTTAEVYPDPLAFYPGGRTLESARN